MLVLQRKIYMSQSHMGRVHGRICREQDANLQLHLMHLNESDDFQDEWVFVESRPIQPGEHNVCPFGQTAIESYFFLENKYNGNRTFVGSECIGNIDPKTAAVICYFKHIPSSETQGQIVEARKSLNGRKNVARRKVKNGEKSTWGQCLTRPVPNGRRRSGF